MGLKNPTFPFTLGDRVIVINLPTVIKDFLDLPVFGDYFKLIRFEQAFYYTLLQNTDDQDRVIDDIMYYYCVKDILKHACIYKIAYMIRHFSIGLIIISIFIIISFIFIYL